MNIPFKDLLIHNAGLLSLSQSDCDLFLIAQANTVTYTQLSLTGLHGKTKASGRLSLKHLEREGHLLSHLLPGAAKEKYYTLTAKAKQRLETIYGSEFLSALSIDLDRRPPSRAMQIPHRIRTGDLYFCYLANPFLAELPVWQIEAAYRDGQKGSPAPRCDAMLQTARKTYYIEQDNNTQGEAALMNKISQYMDAECFLGDGLLQNGLVFTVCCEAKERRTRIPPFSVYRILLKAQRIWNCIEQESGPGLTLMDFCEQIERGGSASLLLLSATDKRVIKQLGIKYPSIRKEELSALKKSFLYDTSSADEQEQAQDAAFLKRLRQKFYPLLDDPDFATFKNRLQRGLLFCVLPNHRLKDYLPYVLQEEYGYSRFLFQLLYTLGISETELWEYHETFQIMETDTAFLFRNVFTCGETDHVIIAEDIAHDLGGRERVRHFLDDHSLTEPVLFLLSVASRDDAMFFFSQFGHMLNQYPNATISLCFFDKSESLYYDPQKLEAYFKSGSLWLPAQLEFDRYTGELMLTERQV